MLLIRERLVKLSRIFYKRKIEIERNRPRYWFSTDESSYSLYICWFPNLFGFIIFPRFPAKYISIFSSLILFFLSSTSLDFSFGRSYLGILFIPQPPRFSSCTLLSAVDTLPRVSSISKSSLEAHAVFFLSCVPFFVSPIKKLLSNLFTTSSTPFSLFVLPFFSLQCSLQPILDSFSPRSNNLLPVFLSPWSSFPPLSFSSVRAAFLRYGTMRQSRAAGGTEKRRP